jgi:hypothetical protein
MCIVPAHAAGERIIVQVAVVISGPAASVQQLGDIIRGR